MKPTVISADHMPDAYVKSLASVLMYGKDVAPRGLPTKELLAFQLELRDPTLSLASGVDRKLSLAVAAAEALQLVGGFSDPRAMLQVSPHFEKFLDGGVLHAPYGPRVLPQLRRVVERLTADQSTRQAVVSIWDPVQDLLVDGSRDYPCTTHLQFMIRDGRCLDLHVSMRANDAWHGHPYDVFQFAFLQCTLAEVLEADPGVYYHHATSFHLYEPQLEAARRIVAEAEPTVPLAYTGLWTEGATPLERLDAAVQRARRLFYGTEVPVTSGEARLWDALRGRGVEGSW